MDWLLNVSEFLQENWLIVKENFFLFAVWTVICIGVALTISTWQSRRMKHMIAQLKSENEALLLKYSALDKKYSDFDEETRLMAGVDDFPCTTAKIMSQNIMKSK